MERTLAFKRRRHARACVVTPWLPIDGHAARARQPHPCGHPDRRLPLGLKSTPLGQRFCLTSVEGACELNLVAMNTISREGVDESAIPNGHTPVLVEYERYGVADPVN